MVGMVGLAVYSLFMWDYTSNVWGIGGFFWTSWIAFALVYLGVAVFLRINRVPTSEAFIISLTSVISMIWLYEILYHFSFWNAWNYGRVPYVFLKDNAIFINYGLIALTALSGYRYMKLNKWALLAVAATVSLWLFWMTIGYPQYEFPSLLYTFGALPRLVMSDPHAWAFPLNSITKFLLSSVYLLLYLPRKERFSAAMTNLLHRLFP